MTDLPTQIMSTHDQSPMRQVSNNANLVDQFGREKRKLRISVTDRCNFKCQYCMPEHPEWLAKKDILSFEALFTFCELMVEQGIESIRITGGEPLMRQGVVHFINDLNRLRAKGLKRISMTTNAHYLAKYAQDLKLAGLDDLNISLDSLDATQFQQLTKKSLQPVLQGVAAAQAVGLKIKINTVLMCGINDDQIIPLVKWGMAQNISVRFIEYMPLDGDALWQKDWVVSEQDILSTLEQEFQITAIAQDHEPARQFAIQNLNDAVQENCSKQTYRIGIISTISNPFCQQCDRLRLTATGELFTCLFSDQGLSFKDKLEQYQKNKDNTLRTEIIDTIKTVVWYKDAGYVSKQRAPLRKISMHAIGG